MCVRILLLCIAVTAACGGPPKQTYEVPLFKGETTATLSSHRCKAGTCVCRATSGADDEEQTPVPEGKKRYEVRVETAPGPGYLVIDGQRIAKGTETTLQCWYVDLPLGDRQVQVQGVGESAQSVVGLAVSLNEYVPEKVAWYRSFGFSCGLPGGCTQEDLRSFGRTAESDLRSITDPCGTARVSGLRWRAGKAPDGTHPHDVTLDFTLTVSGRAPDSAPEDPGCPVR